MLRAFPELEFDSDQSAVAEENRLLRIFLDSVKRKRKILSESAPSGFDIEGTNFSGLTPANRVLRRL
jgi:hypothetical protein